MVSPPLQGFGTTFSPNRFIRRFITMLLGGKDQKCPALPARVFEQQLQHVWLFLRSARNSFREVAAELRRSLGAALQRESLRRASKELHFWIILYYTLFGVLRWSDTKATRGDISYKSTLETYLDHCVLVAVLQDAGSYPRATRTRE